MSGESNFVGLLKSDAAMLSSQLDARPQEVGFFQVRSINQRLEDAKKQPIPERLFLSLMYESEITILVADTNVGKSIFAVQMGEAIAAKGRKVLYLDLELSDKQFERRYSTDFKDHYRFSDNLFCVNFRSMFKVPQGVSYDDYFIDCVRGLITKTGSTVIIIDNMTKLITGDTDSAKSAIPLMEKLISLKFDYGLSLLLLEHTKKVDDTRPVSLNDLQGSKMKANFADAVFTIGRSKRDKSVRYIKQLKVRSCECEYDTDNVIVYEIVKENSFLQFRFIDYGSEWEHLKQPSQEDKAELIPKCKDLQQRGLTQRAIAAELSISLGAVNKYLKL